MHAEIATSCPRPRLTPRCKQVCTIWVYQLGWFNLWNVIDLACYGMQVRVVLTWDCFIDASPVRRTRGGVLQHAFAGRQPPCPTHPCPCTRRGL